MSNLSTLIERHGIDVDEHLDREALVPVLTGLQAQGDVIVIPTKSGKSARSVIDVPAEGVPVVRGEAGGNTHLLLADGHVTWDAITNSLLDLGIVTVGEGSSAWLAHPEHGYTGIGAGTYTIRRQRQQEDEIRRVAD